jgi:hypothetical protein
MLLLLAALLQQPQEPPKTGPDAAPDLERKVRDLEIDIVMLERKIEQAFEEKRYDDAERLVREADRKRNERDRLRDQFRRATTGKLPASYTGWFELRVGTGFAVFDRSLDLEGASGADLSLGIARFFNVSVRWWETDDRLGDGDATVVSILLGMEGPTRLLGSDVSELVWRWGLGRTSIESDAPNGDHEVAFALSVGLSVRTFLSRSVRTEVGFSADEWRTDFNRDRAHWQIVPAIRLSIDVGF